MGRVARTFDIVVAGLLRLDDAAFGRELTRRYHGRLGAKRPVGGRQAVPVVTAYAARFVGRCFGLLGDAAVGMHPTTAHGFNFGMLGQHGLARKVRTALAAGRDVANPSALARYEAAHRTETRLFFTGAEALMRLYTARSRKQKVATRSVLQYDRSRTVARSMRDRMSIPQAEHLAREFFRRVWAPPHDLDAIDELMTEDYRITTAGRLIEGRSNFKRWVAVMQKAVRDATNEHLEIITNPTEDTVVSRWITRGYNEGMFGLPADGRPVEFSGIAIWRVRDRRLAECWVERSALELYEELR